MSMPTIDDVKEMKKILENRLRDYARQFETETGVMIEDLQIYREPKSMGTFKSGRVSRVGVVIILE